MKHLNRGSPGQYPNSTKCYLYPTDDIRMTYDRVSIESFFTEIQEISIELIKPPHLNVYFEYQNLKSEHSHAPIGHQVTSPASFYSTKKKLLDWSLSLTKHCL